MYRWARQQAKLLRAGKLSGLDVANLAEEIESLGGRDRREVLSRLRVLIMHLLKWQYQPDKRSESWRQTIRTQRREIEYLFRQSPSLFRQAELGLPEVYVDAIGDAVDETKLPKKTFPPLSPHSLEKVLDIDFLPE
jgi:hypothetical protein